MLRVGRLAAALQESAFVAGEDGGSVILTTEDGACLVASNDSAELETVGAAAASIFAEFRAAEENISNDAGNLQDFVFKSKTRLVNCRLFASLADGTSLLLSVVAGADSASAEQLRKVGTRIATDLQFLVEPLSKMSKKFNEH